MTTIVRERDADLTIMRVVAPHFVAGVAVRNGRIARTAPVLSYMKGWNGRRFDEYLKSKGWTCEKPR